MKHNPLNIQPLNNRNNIMIAGLIALALHAVVVLAPSITSEPEVIFKKGDSSLKMNLVPSVASAASTKSMNDRQDVRKAEEKIRENQKPVQNLQHQEAEPVAEKESVHEAEKLVRKIEEETSDTPELIEKSERPLEKQVKLENEVAHKVKEITYSAEYFKPEHKVKDQQAQKQKTTTDNSKEIIADIKAKGVTMGAMVKNVFKPEYPLSCKRQGHEGVTILEVTILSNGKRGNIRIIKSAGCKSLDNAAIKSLMKAAYIPAERLGVPFTAAKKIAFNFKLEDYQ